MKKGRFKKWFLIFRNRLKIADVTRTSVPVAYYALLALVPLLIALGNLLPLLNIDPALAGTYLDSILPDVVRPALDPIVTSILTTRSDGILIVALAIFIWSASKAVSHLQRGFDRAYGLVCDRGVVPQRILALIVSLLIMIVLFAFVLVFSFGGAVLEFLSSFSPGLATFTRLLQSVKWPAMLCFVYVMLLLIYLFTPGVRVRVREALAGAGVATIGTIILSELFSFYVRRVSVLLSSYGVLSSFLVLLFWLNFTGIIISVGSVVNASIKEYRTGDASSGKRAFHNLLEDKLNINKIADKIRGKDKE